VEVTREKQRRTHYTAEFKRQALERMKVAKNIVELAKELGIARPLLYQWEAAAAGRGRSKKKQGKKPEETPASKRKQREAAQQDELKWMREALARKVQEVDFFKGALQKVEARHRNNGSGGGAVSTTRSGK
jgi:transposase-like protein